MAEVLGGAALPIALSLYAARCGLANQAGHRVRFVPQSELPDGTAYEAYIHATGCVPTRDNLHDFFNGLIWLHFPRTKASLNAIQARQLAELGLRVRGPVRDAATLFDENAALVISPEPALHDALRVFAWRELFVTHRAWWTGTRVLVFGHALLEKLVTPYRAMTAHAWLMDGSAQSTWPDAALSKRLAATTLSSRLFTPLPVLGIPGWCVDNQDPAFYNDTAVFRPGRRAGIASA